MNTLVIKEFGNISVPGSSCFDLEKITIKDCVGCWTCWCKTPEVCIHKDLEDLYHSYVNADKAMIFAKLEYGFVSSKIKTLLDRMIPLFLPYTVFAKGGTWHSPRYPRYPDIEFYYKYNFQDENEFTIFYDYIQKVFEQFHSKEINIRHISEFQEGLV